MLHFAYYTRQKKKLKMYLFEGLHFESLRHEVSQMCFERGEEQQRERKEKDNEGKSLQIMRFALHGDLNRQPVGTMAPVFYRRYWSSLM